MSPASGAAPSEAETSGKASSPATAGDGVRFVGPERDAFRGAVLGWYRREGRRLPFRGTTDPYLVLVSETILQQTQVSRGAPAWLAFTARFPTVETLAAASPADVLRAWQGLGYNRRAINLRRAAVMVVDELGGRFPTDLAGLERLPGVGPYTARAVASIAYGRPVGAVDTNVRRVLGRAIAGDAAGLTRSDLQATADALAQVDRPADWTAALMDLGSTVCRPRLPLCGACPIAELCRFAGRTSAAAAPSFVPRALAIRERPAPFHRSSRWLRGRILDRLREVESDDWDVFDEAIGEHDRAAVAGALHVLAGEALIELAPHGDPASSADSAAGSRRSSLPLRARLPLV